MDRDYIWKVAQAVIRRPKATIWPMLCTLQHLALINYEGRSHLAKTDPSQLPTTRSLEPDAVAASRHANKLFLDTARYVDGLVEHYAAISRQHHRRFFDPARGHRGMLLDWLRSDLGIARYRQHLVGTTHTVHYTIGLPPEAFGTPTMGPRVRDMSEGLAAFARPDPESSSEDDCWLDLVDEQEITTSDVKSSKFYGRAFGKNVAPGITAALLSLQAACSTTDLLIGESPRLADDSWPVPVFKLRYITVFQTLESLRYLTETHGATIPALTISDSAPAQIVLSSGGRKLRNTLVHYGVKIPGTTQLPADRPLFGLVEHYLAGLSYEQLCVVVDGLLHDLNGSFRDWSAVP
jgi:hypothetical protein